jgi:hypothetical protein
MSLAWNDSMERDIAEPTRHAQMSRDIKRFVFQAEEKEKARVERETIIQMRTAEKSNLTRRIYRTLGFAHHDGTDASAELKAVKILLIREGHLSNLQHRCQRLHKANLTHKAENRALQAFLLPIFTAFYSSM